MIGTPISPLTFNTAAASIGSAAGQATASAASISGSAAGSNNAFAGLVSAGLDQARGLEQHAQSAVVDLLRGGNTEVHSAMIATQQSELAFELALQVRNKAVAAYQQMMQMQF